MPCEDLEGKKMVKSIHTTLKSRLLSATTRFVRAHDGIAAIEFAIIAPIMLFMYFGLAEIAAAISVDRQISHSANVAGDLATQSETVSAAEMSEIMTATMMVMGIGEGTKVDGAKKKESITIEIASYARADDDSIIEKGKAVLKGTNGIDFPDFNAEKLDKRILSSSSGVVVARVNYVYEPLKLRYMPTDFSISEVFMLKPRKSINVEIGDSSGPIEYSCDFSGAGGKPSCS